MRRQLYTADVDGLIEDEDLQRLITDQINNDPAFWLGRGRRGAMIVVEADDGYVTLSGYVRTALDRRRADILARALGAQGVDNRLRLQGEVEERPA